MRRLLPLLALAMVGCATPYGKSAPGWVVRKMSYEGRLWLLDAEEELAVAQLKLEEAEAEHERARKARASAERKLARAAKAVEAVDAEKDAPTLAANEAEAFLEYALAAEAQAADRVELERLSLHCARARYELAKIQVAKKVRLADADELDEAPLAKQARRCEEDLEELRDQSRQLEVRVSRARAEWERRRSQLSQRVSLARPGPYLE